MRPTLPLVLTAAGVALALGACRPEAPAAPPRPPGEVFQGPGAAYIFYRPPVWWRVVKPTVAEPDSGAASRIEWKLSTQTPANDPLLLTLRTYTPAAWATASAPGRAPVGAVVAQDDSLVVVATVPNNPYEEGEPARLRFDSLSVPLDTVRARLVIR